MTKMPFEFTFHLPAEGLDEGSDVDFFFDRVNTKKKSFLPTSAANISEYYQLIFAMFTMPRKVLLNLNWPRAVVLSRLD